MKKKSFVLICVLAVLITVCLSVSVFASDATKYKTVSSYDKNSGTLTFDVYIAGGKAIVGYCSFDYDSSVLTLVDTNSAIVPDDVPDTSEDSSSIYLRSVVKANGDFVITDNGKGTSNLINTDEGYVFFAWFIPSSVAENVDATDKDILIASIKFNVNEGKAPDSNSVKVATKKLTDNVNGWYPGLIVVVNREKVQNHYNGENIGTEYYEAVFNSNEEKNNGETTENVESEKVKEAETNDSKTNEEPTESDKTVSNEENGAAEDATESKDNVVTETEEKKEEEKEEISENEGADDTSSETTPEDSVDIGKVDSETEADTNNNAGIKEEKKEKTPAYAQKKDFSIDVTDITNEKAKITWNTPDTLEEIDSFTLVLCDKDFDIIKSVSGIISVTASYTIENLCDGTDYNVYLIAKSGNKQYVSHVTGFTTAANAENPAIVSFTVTYKTSKNVSLYGFESELVLYGGHVSKVPKVTPKNSEQIFLGWSKDKDSNTIIDIYNLKIYSDTTLYPVLDDEKTDHESYINGYDNGTFNPTGNITRAETAALISRISDKYDASKPYLHRFTDCKEGMWYNKAVAFCYIHDYIKGYDNGTFNPTGSITRAEFATILVRVFGFDDVIGLNVFADMNGHWAESYVSVLYKSGIVKPDKNGNFRPNEKLTRQDAVKMLNGCLGIIPDRNSIDAEVADKGCIFSDVPYSEYYYDIMAAVLG